jgi:hypothetical protein
MECDSVINKVNPSTSYPVSVNFWGHKRPEKRKLSKALTIQNFQNFQNFNDKKF